MNTFDDDQLEKFLALLKNSKIEIYVLGTTTSSVQINHLRTMLCGQALREFDEFQSQNGGLTNNYLKLITEGLIEYLFPINYISKQIRATRIAMRRP